MRKKINRIRVYLQDASLNPFTFKIILNSLYTHIIRIKKGLQTSKNITDSTDFHSDRLTRSTITKIKREAKLVEGKI